MACDGLHTGILAHGNSSVGVWNHQRFVCGGGMAATSIPLAVGGWSAGRFDWCSVSRDVNAGLLRNGGRKSGTGGCGGREKGGGCGR